MPFCSDNIVWLGISYIIYCPAYFEPDRPGIAELVKIEI